MKRTDRHNTAPVRSPENRLTVRRSPSPCVVEDHLGARDDASRAIVALTVTSTSSSKTTAARERPCLQRRHRSIPCFPVPSQTSRKKFRQSSNAPSTAAPADELTALIHETMTTRAVLSSRAPAFRAALTRFFATLVGLREDLSSLSMCSSSSLL